MVYLHCGWPKTGTTSFQATMARHERLLAEEGVLYPTLYRSEEDGHNGLMDVVAASRRSGGAAWGQFQKFVGDQRDRHLVFSSEGLTTWLITAQRYESLAAFLELVQMIAPVKCVWTLRRFDEVIHSHNLEPLPDNRPRFGLYGGRAAEVMEALDFGDIFGRMRKIGEVVDDVAYIKYEPAGGHNRELLSALRIPAQPAEAILKELQALPRRNVSLTQKEAIAMNHADELSERLGLWVDRRTLLEVFQQGLRFPDDCPFELAGAVARRRLHERMLEAAERGGLSAYVRFFADTSVDTAQEATRVELDVLSDEDLRRLAEHLRRAAPRGLGVNYTE